MTKIPLKIGVKLEPPSIIYIYREDGSMRLRRMPVRNLGPGSVKELRERHQKEIEELEDTSLERMIQILEATRDGESLEEAIKKFGETSKSVAKNNEINVPIRNDVIVKNNRVGGSVSSLFDEMRLAEVRRTTPQFNKSKLKNTDEKIDKNVHKTNKTDDTDVEFDESDNPFDDQDEDFW